MFCRGRKPKGNKFLLQNIYHAENVEEPKKMHTHIHRKALRLGYAEVCTNTTQHIALRHMSRAGANTKT